MIHWRKTFLIWLALPVAAFAQDFDARHRSDIAKNPTDLLFRLSTPKDSASFHRGERIPILLDFSADSPQKYKLDGATYDRSGRLMTEEFVLERRDVVDPFADYFNTRVFGRLGGGLRNYPVLDAKPYRIELDLNTSHRSIERRRHVSAVFRLDGTRAPTLAALKEKLKLYPAGTVFRWCPQVNVPFDAFTPGQRDDMFRELQTFLTARSLRIEPYDQGHCAITR